MDHALRHSALRIGSRISRRTELVERFRGQILGGGAQEERTGVQGATNAGVDGIMIWLNCTGTHGDRTAAHPFRQSF